jgi:dihydrofolate reductase
LLGIDDGGGIIKLTTRAGGVMSKPTAETTQELMVDFITSLDGYGSAEGWPGWWGLEGPEYLGWLESGGSDFTALMGAKTYELMAGMAQGAAAGEMPDGVEELRPEEEGSVDELTQAEKIVFSSTLDDPLTWPNSTLVRGDAVAAVRALQEDGEGLLSTLGSVSLCRSLMEAGLVDRFRVVIFPVITGRTGADRIYDGYQDFALELVESRTFDDRSQLLEYVPRLLDAPLKR